MSSCHKARRSLYPEHNNDFARQSEAGLECLSGHQD